MPINNQNINRLYYDVRSRELVVTNEFGSIDVFQGAILTNFDTRQEQNEVSFSSYGHRPYRTSGKMQYSAKIEFIVENIKNQSTSPIVSKNNVMFHVASKSSAVPAHLLGFDMMVKCGDKFDVRRLSSGVTLPASRAEIDVAVDEALEEMRPWLIKLMSKELEDRK